MNTDVIPPIGGYLPVYVETNGYIVGIESNQDVHKETRDMDEWEGCFMSFADAKRYLSETPNHEPDLIAILQLNQDGGGEAIWTFLENVAEVDSRRNRFRGCYGAWPIHTLSI